MSFRTRRAGLCSGAGEKSYTICITNIQVEYARCRRFLLAHILLPQPLVRNDIVYIKFKSENVASVRQLPNRNIFSPINCLTYNY